MARADRVRSGKRRTGFYDQNNAGGDAENAQPSFPWDMFAQEEAGADRVDDEAEGGGRYGDAELSDREQGEQGEKACRITDAAQDDHPAGDDIADGACQAGGSEVSQLTALRHTFGTENIATGTRGDG